MLIGITRQAVMGIAKAAGITVVEKNLTRFEAFMWRMNASSHGTGAEVIAVTQIDSRKIGDGKVGGVTKQLMEGFHRKVRGE